MMQPITDLSIHSDINEINDATKMEKNNIHEIETSLHEMNTYSPEVLGSRNNIRKRRDLPSNKTNTDS